jgi:hypothetical protein
VCGKGKKMTIKELTEIIMKQAKEKGFGTTPEEINVGEKIALIHTQVSSAYEGYRNKKMTGEWSFENEMAGAIQRIIHLCGILGIDVEKALKEKIEEVDGREWNWDNLNERHS